VAPVAVVVITHNSAGVLVACLRSIAAAGCAETVIVDNASNDDTAMTARSHCDAESGVRLIANPVNRGFAGGVNDGFRATRARYVLLLNPDAELSVAFDWNRLLQACEEFGLASGLLVDSHGKPQQGFFARALPTPAALAFEALGLNRLWPTNPVNRRYRCLDLPFDREAFVEQPPGAFLLIRRDVWETLGGFDEAFHPVWFEDADFCRRAIDHGFRIRFVPSCVVRHQGGHSVLQTPGADRAVRWYGSLLRYAAKHFAASGFRIVCMTVALGAVGRALASVLGAGFRSDLGPRGWSKTVRMCGTIIRLASVALWSGKVPDSAALEQGKVVVSAVEH
jgi:N-acetylglucosaminyl-diphospho-decaprenol L-rhamnosyltransferase